MGKRVSIVSGESNEWTRYSYTSSAIEKRTGLTRREIEQMRREAREETQENPFKREDDVFGIDRQLDQPEKPKLGIDLRKNIPEPIERVTKLDTPISVEWGTEGVEKASLNIPLGIGGVSIAYGPEDGIQGSVSALGFGVEKKEGGGKVELPGGISIDFVEKGCYVVEVYRIFGQYTHSNIQKKPNCDDDDGDDNGGGGDTPKPPHCVNSDGSRGKGDARNLLPECTNDGQRHTYIYQVYYHVLDENEEWSRFNLRYSFYQGESTATFIRYDEQNNNFWYRLSGYSKRIWENHTEIIDNKPEPTEAFISTQNLSRFIGTYSQFQDH